MDPRRSERLIRTAPSFFRRDVSEPFAERGFECGDGWYELLLGLSSRAEIRGSVARHVDKDPREFYVTQVKEKFGRLTVYVNDSKRTDLVDIASYEQKSAFICETCGAPGTLQLVGHCWGVVCDEHLKLWQKEGPIGRWLVRPHQWATETIGHEDDPIDGPTDFFKCSVCDASGGIALSGDEPLGQPFLAGLGSSHPISFDCPTATRQIEAIKTGDEWKKKLLAMYRMYGEELLKHLAKRGVTGKVAKKAIVYGGFPDREGRAFELVPQSEEGWVLRWSGLSEEAITNFSTLLARLDALYLSLKSD